MALTFVPVDHPDSWQQFLADPHKQWKMGYSARTLAYCWHAAKGFPAEITAALKTVHVFDSATPLLIFPEYKVKLSGRGADSQNDVFVLAKAADNHLMSVMIEGKVEESFGQTVGRWKTAGSGFTENKQHRLNSLQETLNLPAIPDEIYYQLLHRTASAVLEAQKFNAKYALMLVHSFSPSAIWFAEYAQFIALYDTVADKGTLHHLTQVNGIDLYAAWATGDPQFLTM